MPRESGPNQEERDGVRFGRTAEAFVLLILAQGRSYGYEIRRRLEGFGYVRMASDPGVLYRLLRDLEASGAIASEWDIAGTGPARRYYSLTPAGREQLKHGAEKLSRLKDNIERFLAAFALLDLDVSEQISGQETQALSAGR